LLLGGDQQGLAGGGDDCLFLLLQYCTVRVYSTETVDAGSSLSVSLSLAASFESDPRRTGQKPVLCYRQGVADGSGVDARREPIHPLYSRERRERDP